MGTWLHARARASFALVLIAASLSPSVSGADVSSNWAGVADLGGERQNHTSTLLSDGRVLAAGGRRGVFHEDGGFWTDEPVADVDVFDPSTGEWSLAPPLLHPRAFHTATLLRDGRVLVVGGHSETEWFEGTTTAEIFDPSAWRWTRASSSRTTHMAHTASLLASGRVLITGRDPGGWPNRAEIYDPATDSWSDAVQPGRDYVYHDAVTLDDGRVLVFGGCGVDERASELFDASTSTWSTVAMKADHCLGRGVLLADGRVLVTGGAYDEDQEAAEIFDPSTMQWSRVADMNIGRLGHVMVVLDEDRVLVAGGDNPSPEAWSSAEIYQIDDGTWRTVSPMAMRRIEGSATRLTDGRVLVSGGYDTGLANSEIFDPREPSDLTADRFTQSSASFRAHLETLDGEPIQGRTIGFVVESTTYCSAVTNAQGIAQCRPAGAQLGAAILALARAKSFEARFQGDEVYLDVADVAEWL